MEAVNLWKLVYLKMLSPCFAGFSQAHLLSSLKLCPKKSHTKKIIPMFFFMTVFHYYKIIK